ncbi:MAG: prolipoprotein diacylglyceryl transferase [Rickettsiales bacterium]|nr:prolipoprotein diacylglyceryl transferase [Rickettsiales bacterium]
MILPAIDPVALQIGPLEIRWYSLAYIAGVLFNLFWLKKINRQDNFLSESAYENWLLWAVLSIILGGRLGYVFFYNPHYFLNHPLEIFAIWQGGMSFHGGLFGAIFGMWLFAKKYQINFLQLTDVLAISAPIGLFFGRLANFVNMELYGRISGSNFGVVFPNAGDLPRHPSQLYEAALEGIALFLILFLLNHFTKIRKYHGALSGCFLAFYACFRISIENFREPDAQIGFLFYKVTMGQILSFPLAIVGFFLVVLALRKEQKKI